MKRYSLIISFIILSLLFLKLSSNYSDRFDEVSNTYNNTSSVNLTKGTDYTKIVKALSAVEHIDNRDAIFIAKHIEDKLKKGTPLNSLYDLNERIWQISSTVIDSIGSSGLKKKLEKSRESLGQDKEYAFRSLPANLKSLSDTLNLYAGNGVIKVKVTEIKDTIDNIFRLFPKKIKEPCQKVLIRLSEHYIDSSGVNAKKKPIDSLVVRKTLAWAKTNNEGECTFSGLDANKSYSVLPIKKGYEYGMSQGTTSGSLINSSKDGILTCSFTQKEHKIRMFDAKTLAQIKERHTLTLRTPQEYKHISTLYLILFFAAWWGVYLIWAHKHKNSDNSVIAILMSLTGLCFLMMQSLYDPLEDALYGIDMAQGIIIGVVVIGILQYVNFTKLYQDKLRISFDFPLECIKWLFKPFPKKILGLIQVLSNKKYKAHRKWIALLGIILSLPLLLLDLIRILGLKLIRFLWLILIRIWPILGDWGEALTTFHKGCGYLLTALLLTLSLLLFGSGPGGMKVNIELPGMTFQPSEIAKYLIVFFMAAFFSCNADSIIKYSKKGNLRLFGHKSKILIVITSGLCLLLLLYLGLGDMGPALILAFTFIILYSVVKSKVDLENLDESGQDTKILTCDLAMLAYGVISFIAFLYIGNAIDHMGFFCLVWFILWIILGLARKQIFESAILFNLIIVAFIYGGKVLNDSNAQRLESRNEMCLNTWGTLPIDGMVAKAGENTQIAEGLWGLASGGIWGQGLGEGSPHFIPAFHTDMIMASIGEQLGFLGIFVVIFLLSLLLRKAVLIGYQTSHPFAFYLCSGIAIVTAIQFAIISLGSTGIIPLTGVTVPFLSYGKVSIILNLAAFGIILSYTPTTVKNKAKAHLISEKNIGQYNYPVSVLSWLYCALAVFVGSVFFYYQFINRNETLVRPVYVNNVNGIPIVEYNPRIKPLIHKMYAGDIYDRNHTLLATSDKSKLLLHKDIYSKYGLMYDTLKQQQRYYPFGEHLFFILGDYNSKMFFSSIEKNPRGYMAEARHMAELHGYDDVLRNSQGNPVEVVLQSKEYRPGIFYSPTYSRTKKEELKDYSALIPYLKAGLNSKKITRLNTRDLWFWESNTVSPKDIQLTIDAKLQVRLQQKMIEYMRRNYLEAKWNKCRVSVVVLNAKEGDLLASANYPLPNYNQLRNAPDVYSDNHKRTSWKAYSDIDLGLAYPTPPGSTVKIISALAGFRKEGDKIASQTYNVDAKERIYTKEPMGILDMKDALRHSSNCYFVNLVNDKCLYHELAYIYGNVGFQINNKKSYTINYSETNNEWNENIINQEEKCVQAYVAYKKSGIKEPMNHRTGKPIEWAWAWGQNGIEATPITMARAISIVINDGKMPVTKYLLKTPPEEIEIVPSHVVDSMIDFLKFTAKEHDKFNMPALGGKTGTPERNWKSISNRTQIINDGWFVCFIENASIPSIENNKETTHHRPLAIAVRMERINDDMSRKAVDFTKKVVIEVLKEAEYID